MNTLINGLESTHPRLRQWLWFITLWLAGLVAVFALTYPIKWLIRMLG
jgi:hypothetical protein